MKINPFTQPKKEKSCLFHYQSKFKFGWDLLTTFLLFIICLVMPVHIAFKNETDTWCWIYQCMDLIFLIDMIFSFFTTIPHSSTEQEVTDRKEIAVQYLKTWFPIELLAIIPVDLIVSSLMGKPSICGMHGDCHTYEEEDGAPQANVVLRLPRLIKLARMIRILRMLKVMKLVKNKENL